MDRNSLERILPERWRRFWVPAFSDLDEIVLQVKNSTVQRGPRKAVAVAIFDLAGSARLKLDKGHLEGRDQALRHNLLCSRVVEGFGGRVVKGLGDGILALFPDAVDACRGAIEIKRGVSMLGTLATRAALTFGYVEEIRLGGGVDVYGSTVDRCAHLALLAGAGQLLIDGALQEAARSMLADHGDIGLGSECRVRLKTGEQVDVYELSTKAWGFHGGLVGLTTQLRVHDEGRLSIANKVAFYQAARTEIIELGIGLKTFVNNVLSRKPSEFGDHLAAALRRGVTLRCAVVDPTWPGLAQYGQDSGERGLERDVASALPRLEQAGQELLRRAGGGSVEVYLYAHSPRFHVSVVDGADDRWGRLTVSPYLFGVRRSQCPVLQFSRLSNPSMFETYWRSVQALLDGGRRVF
jgi:class 3 adenylate cyclase